MRRRTTIRVGALLGFALGTVALYGLGPSPAAMAATAQSQAPRVPLPSPSRRIPASGSEASCSAPNMCSSNWSGYVLQGSFTSVVGTWTVPTVVAPTKKKRTNRFSSSWVGIDGDENSDLIQAGTEQDWYHRRAAYQAWWETLQPNGELPEQPILSLTIHPGDSMSVSITEGAALQWTISVSDLTTGRNFTVVRTYRGPGTSAEWIQETPTIGRRLATLADDTTVTFDHGRVNGLNPALTTSDRIIMVSKAFVPIETPSTPNTNRDGFAVAYGSVAPPAPSS